MRKSLNNCQGKFLAEYQEFLRNFWKNFGDFKKVFVRTSKESSTRDLENSRMISEKSLERLEKEICGEHLMKTLKIFLENLCRNICKIPEKFFVKLRRDFKEILYHNISRKSADSSRIFKKFRGKSTEIPRNFF